MWEIRFALGWWLFRLAFRILPDCDFKDALCCMALDELKPEDAPHKMKNP